MGHGRGQPDRLPLARPLARSLAHARGTGHPPGGKGTRYESHARGPTPGPASTRLAPPPHPAPTRSSGGEAPGVGGRREHRRAAARGSTSRRARGRAGGAGRGRERRTTTTRPRDPTGRGERTRRGAEDRRRRRRRRAAGEGATRRKTRRSPPDRQGPPLPPPLSLHATSRACAAKTPHDRRVAGSRAPNPLERHQNPAGSGARGTARPQPGGKRAAAEGHRGVPRATTGARIPGARPRARHGLGASRPPRQGEALFGGGRGARKEPQAARRTAAGSRPDTAATAAAAALGARGKREAAAARTRPPDRYRAGSQPRGAGTRPDAPTPPPAKHTMPKRPLAARGGSQRDGGGQGQRPRREPSGPSLPSHGRRAPPQGLAAAAARPQPTHPTVPHALRQASGRRGQGVGGGGVRGRYGRRQRGRASVCT